ncbi:MULTISPECIES: protein-L-isoaspartate O-methyltransferase family protein [Glycomyces]|uniref:Protein-L-isoaspartate O-methyltransferase n=2 Tax=Glycomyces TaxID=58113 RepID=A0A9X3PQ15_9ACTN|nr:hypothetical protein [Glycomyces lechevalierae]MDA1387142.1 hypothetical protein [Glycomyces lechevalierae]
MYSDTPLLTKLDADGRGISSSSQPSIMAIMLDALDALDVQAAHRVLEVGAGTGYNAALLANFERTWKAPDTKGVAVIEADGTNPPPGPWDRLIATYAFDAIPPVWLTAV